MLIRKPNGIQNLNRWMTAIVLVFLPSFFCEASVSQNQLMQIKEPLNHIKIKTQAVDRSFLLAGVSVFDGEKTENYHASRLSEIQFVKQQYTEDGVGLNYEAGFIYTNEAESFPYPNVLDLYYGTKTKNNLSWSFGRKAVAWSQFDKIWKLGLWQPTVATNLLRPYEQGLTGIFLNYKKAPIRFTGFVSALHIPSVGPQFQVRGGQLLSSNRWFQAPIQSAQIQDVEVGVDYEVELPALAEIVNQMGVGFLSQWGLEYGPWGQLSMAYKPMNTLHMQFESPKIAPDQNNEIRVPVVVHPTAIMHSLATIELGWKSKRFNSWISFTDDRPTPPRLEEGMSQPAISNSQFFAVQLEHDLKVIGKQQWQVQWGAFKRVEQIKVRETVEEDFTIDFSETRFPYSEALMVGTRMNFHAGLPGEISTQFIYSPGQKGAALLADVQIYTSSGLGLLLSVDIIGSEEPDVNTFFNSNRNNDRFFGGISYVF